MPIFSKKDILYTVWQNLDGEILTNLKQFVKILPFKIFLQYTRLIVKFSLIHQNFLPSKFCTGKSAITPQFNSPLQKSGSACGSAASTSPTYSLSLCINSSFSNRNYSAAAIILLYITICIKLYICTSYYVSYYTF